MKVLGVITNDRLRATDHVNSSLLFALRVLRSRGIPTVSFIIIIFNFIARRVPINGSVAKITYCKPAWSGTCTAADRTKLDAFF